jgi:hypothetical protein
MRSARAACAQFSYVTQVGSPVVNLVEPPSPVWSPRAGRAVSVALASIAPTPVLALRLLGLLVTPVYWRAAQQSVC